MISCQDVESRLPDLLREDLPSDLAFHLESCAGCREKRQQWGQLWSLMDQWGEERPSSGVEVFILSRVRERLRREMKKKRRDSWRNLAETFLPFLAATATAFLAVTLGVKKVGPALQLFSPLVLLICGIAWVAIYNVMFFLSIGKVGGGYRIKHVQLNLFARYALVALGVWIFLSWLTDLSGFDRFAAGFLDELTPGSQHFFLGTFYTFIPLALVSLFLRGEGLGIAYIHGILIGFFFLLLLSPAIFLYCGSFSLGIAFSWTVGTLLGCATGGPFSVWLGRRSVPGLPA